MKKYILNSLGILFLFIHSVCLGQTAKTWSGATSSNWGTASNWTPSGVPGSSDNITIPNVTNDPVLDASRTAGTITFQSGASLDFGTYTLTASGLVSASTSSLSNGKLVASAGFNSSSSTVDVFLQATGNSLTINTSTFKKTVYLTKTGATAVTCYGNTFEKPFHITSTATAAISFGYGSADTFKDSVLALVSGSAAINFASYSANNSFEGFSRFERGSSATGNGIYFCNANSSASVNFLGKVEVGSASGTVYTGFEITRNATFSSGAKLKISPMGWNGCNLNISGITSSDSVVLNLGGTSILNMLGTSSYNSPVVVTSPRVFLGAQTFNSSFNLTKTGASTDQSSSSLICNGPVNINNTGSGYLLLPGNSNEVFASTVSISNTSNGQIDICRNGLSTFNGKVTLTITSGIITLANLATTSAHFNGDIELNATGGSVILGKLDHANGYKLTTPTYTAGTLYLNKYVYNSTDSLNLTASGTARLYLTNCEVHGPAKFIFPAVLFAGAGEFYENTLFVKTGSSSEDGAGGLFFHKKAHFKTTGSGNLQINYSGANCVYNDDMIIECTGSGKICPGYTGNHNLYKNLEFRGSTLPNMSYGSNMRFIGSQDQHISSSGLSSGHQIVKLEINKPSGNVVLDVPISVVVQLKLSKGLIQTTSSNLLTASSSMAYSGIVGGSDSSYVDGPMAKTGTIAFIYPIGGGGQYAPLNTDALSSSTTFKAQYFGVDPNSLYSRSSKDASLGFINRCGYWQLDRISGTGTTKAKLGWNNNPCFSSNPVDAKVALWDGSQWKDKGNGAYSGNNTFGFVQVYSNLTSFPAVLNLAGVCPSNVILSRDSFDVNLFGSIKFKAISDISGTFNFYVNNDLKQNSKDNLFLTHSLFTGDTIKVTVDEINMCLVSDKIIINQLLPSECTVVPSQNISLNSNSAYSSSQYTCGCNSAIFNGNDITSKYQRLTSFIPNNESIPIKTINFNIIVPQDPNQPHGGNFNIWFDKFLRKAFEEASKHYEQVIQSSDVLSNEALFISDSKIRLKLNRIYYFENSSIFVADRNDVIQYVENNIDCNVKKSINLILSEKVRPANHPDVWGSSIIPYCGENSDLNVFTIRSILNNFGDVNGYLDYLLLNYPESLVPDLLCQSILPYGDGAWWISQLSTHWAHEIGHSLDLFHTYDGNNNGVWDNSTIDASSPETNIISHFDFLSDIFSLTDPYFNSTWCNPANGLVCYHQNYNACNGVPTASINDPNNPCNVYGTNNLMGNLTVGRAYISPMQMGKIHRALSLKTSRKYVADCPYSEIPIEIIEDENWNMDIRLYNDVIVRSGSTLTISCNVSFPESAQLTVEPGARLILDGGKLTGSCNMWKGIRLMGVSNQQQGTVNVVLSNTPIIINNINTQQGLLLMKNATIENAEEGVFMSDADGNLYNGHTGGIIKAYKSTFRNNFRSVAFHPYKPSSISKFIECSFICDDHLKNLDYYNSTFDTWAGPQGFVSLWGVRDVEFIDNKFINDLDYVIEGECPSDDLTKPFTRLNRGDGIGAYDSRFIVRSTDPDNPTNPKRNEFIGLTAGIKFRHTQPSFSKWIHCQDAYFYNVQHGILIENSFSNDLQRNSFYLPDGTGQTTGSSLNTEPYGIFAHKYKGTRIIDNTFQTISAAGYSNWGTILRGDNAMLNSSAWFTGNVFTGMPTALQTETTAPSIVTNCNSFTGITKEWNLFPENEPLDLKVFRDQGTGCNITQTRVGNKFYDSGDHIWSRANNTWTYYFRGGVTIEKPQFHYNTAEGYGLSNGGRQPCSIGADPCASSGGGGTNIHVVHAQRRSLKEEQTAVNVSISAWTVDAGNSSAVLAEIADTMLLSDSLTAHLKLHSPLSDTVLISAYLSDRSFSNSQLFGIAERNLPASIPVYNALRSRLASSRTYDAVADTLDMLQSYNNSYTTKEALIREADGLESAWLAEISKAVYYYAENDSLQALIPLFKDSLAGNGFEKELIEAAFSLDSLSLARTTLDSLDLVTGDDSLYADYAYLNLDMMEDTLTWLQIDSVQKQQLEFLSRVPSSIQSYAMAARMLRGDTMYHRYPYIDEPSGARIAGAQIEPQRKKEVKSEIGIYPNPNKGIFTLNVIGTPTGNLAFEIVDITGRTLHRGSFVKRENKHTENIQLDHLSVGIYFCRVYTANKEVLGVQRIIISR